MRTTIIGDGVTVTTLGLGTAQFGNLYRPTSDAEVAEAFDAVWADGVRYFDTAPHYGLGLSERRLGALLRGRPRSEFTVSTKVGRLIEPNPDPRGADQQDTQGFAVPATSIRRLDYSADGVRRSLDASLERLGLDRVDIVYVHDPDDYADQVLDEALPALIRLREEGVVGAIGVGMNQSALPARFVAESDIDVVMLAGRYSLLDQSALDDLLPLAVERDVAIVIAGVYNSGLLSTDRPSPDAQYDYETASAGLVERADAIADVCERHGVTLPEAALAFPWLHPAVAAVVVGMRGRAQAVENLRRARVAVPDDLWSDLAAEGLLHPGVPGITARTAAGAAPTKGPAS
ncbi:D-threo-aldose 1-dehydrogenase [Labedella gwakjiensis]|uniref:Aldo/keto reductase n=1 Tax=Labedella gwakjiensis TaxID=390269 RepID=A0A2P8GU78_9MICO|nr:aldo/keto reductase [Labedella gwakjiensis]PSL37522.1 D-threo-aldose 1-dehydrogenase [Labedella gwakjiensis]RUQ84823.1 aldo/keto reductase [Labedella gwakjiensis]